MHKSGFDPMLHLYHPGQSGYRQLQVAVRGHYERHHGARPWPVPDLFCGLTTQPGHAPGLGCIGLSWGGDSGLFSECYLDQPIAATCRVPPSRIVEIGQFAAFCPGVGAHLLTRVLRFLMAKQDRYALLTGTDRVLKLLARLGVGVRHLGPARIGRVRNPEVEWGRYYQTAPQVVLIDLQRRLEGLRIAPLPALQAYAA